MGEHDIPLQLFHGIPGDDAARKSSEAGIDAIDGPALRHDALDHLVRFFDGTVSLRAVLDRQHDDHCVELVANVRRGVVLVVDSRRDSISEAVDEAIERMGRVLKRHKNKLREAPRRKARSG